MVKPCAKSGKTKGGARLAKLPLVKCDFCTSETAVRSYSAEPFVMDPARPPVLNHPLYSNGAWHACARCADLIDAGRWEDLVERAVNAHQQKYPALRGPYNRAALRGAISRTYETLRLSVRPAAPAHFSVNPAH
jgi:hypothetical protein